MKLPELPEGYAWREHSYLVDVMIVVSVLRIVKITPRKYWFAKVSVVSEARFSGWGNGAPGDGARAWAGIAAGEVWKRLEK